MDDVNHNGGRGYVEGYTLRVGDVRITYQPMWDPEYPWVVAERGTVKRHEKSLYVAKLRYGNVKWAEHIPEVKF